MRIAYGRYGAVNFLLVVSLCLALIPTQTLCMLTLKKLIEAKLLSHVFGDHHHHEPQYIAVPVPVGGPPPPIRHVPLPPPQPPIPEPEARPSFIAAPIPIPIPVHHFHFPIPESRLPAFSGNEFTPSQLAALARQYELLNRIHNSRMTPMFMEAAPGEITPRNVPKNVTDEAVMNMMKQIQMEQVLKSLSPNVFDTSENFPMSVMGELEMVENDKPEREKEEISDLRDSDPAYIGKLSPNTPKKHLPPEQLKKHLTRYAEELEQMRKSPKKKETPNKDYDVLMQPPPQRPKVSEKAPSYQMLEPLRQAPLHKPQTAQISHFLNGHLEQPRMIQRFPATPQNIPPQYHPRFMAEPGRQNAADKPRPIPTQPQTIQKAPFIYHRTTHHGNIPQQAGGKMHVNNHNMPIREQGPYRSFQRFEPQAGSYVPQ